MKDTMRILVLISLATVLLLGGLAGSTLSIRQAEAAPLQAFDPPVLVTALPVKEASTTIFLQPVKIGDIGNFSIHNPASLVEITYQGRLSYLGIGGTLFQLRVDNKPLAKFTGEFAIQDNNPNANVPATFSGYLEPASASPTCGACEHTVSLWAWEFEGGMIEGRAVMNPGGLEGSVVMVKEYMPFGNSYIPVVQK